MWRNGSIKGTIEDESRKKKDRPHFAEGGGSRWTSQGYWSYGRQKELSNFKNRR